jgi:DegV family protein with EDD domain
LICTKKQIGGEKIMKKFIVIPDVTCDLSKEIRDEFNLKDYIKGHVHINDTDVRTTLDWDTMSREDFYKTLANDKNKVVSATASPEEYYQIFKQYAEEGYDILSMSISSKISATYNVSVSAAERIKQEYPECNIYCLDSLRMSGSFGLLVMYACEMCENGSSLDETVAWLEENKVRIHQMGPIDDLKYVARRGQISSGKAFMGNLVGIKPMGDCNQEGYVTVLTKVKGIKKALDITVSYVKRTATDIENQYILISHSNRENYAMTLKENIEKSLKCKKVFISDVFSASGTNIGAGMIGVYFMGEPVTEGCTKEKEIMNLVISEN